MPVDDSGFDHIVIRFAGDSGDGMQLTGAQFAAAVAHKGNEIVTLPDYPSEIRAPSGTTSGVSGFQLNFGKSSVFTPGDEVDVLVAMNPAALKVNIANLAIDGFVIIDVDAFNQKAFDKAGYRANPLTDGSLDSIDLYELPITAQTLEVLKDSDIPRKDRIRCKNFFTLGILLWMHDQDPEYTIQYITSKFASQPALADANIRVLREGITYARNYGLTQLRFKSKRSQLPPGTYRNISGNQATALGLVAASKRSNLKLFLGSYPITPATDIFHELALHKHHGVKTFQAEDEIAGICSAIGASFAGGLGATTTSGPGMSLKSEALGLAVISELPLVVVNVQRGGPSTGLPTKTEQSDLLQAMFGRHGECPMPVLAAKTPADCFYMTLEAARIALKYMTPVILLTDGYLGNGSEPFLIPDVDDLPDLSTLVKAVNAETYMPYRRNPDTLAREWAIPGSKGLQHRIGGLEKDNLTGCVSHDPDNHQHMTLIRREKVAHICNDIPDLQIFGDQEGGEIGIFSWGSTYGAIRGKVEKYRAEGKSVSHIHFSHLNPFPKNTEAVLKQFENVVVAEMNLGQLDILLRSSFLVATTPLTKVQGKPFKESEIAAVVDELLEAKADMSSNSNRDFSDEQPEFI